MMALSARSVACCVAMPRGAPSNRRSNVLAHTTSMPSSTPASFPRPCRNRQGCGGVCSGSGKPCRHAKLLAPPPEALGIYYSTATGHTQEVADLIKEALGDAANEPKDIGDIADLAAELTDASLDGLVVGAPTWNTGADEGRSGTAWDNVMQQVKGLDLKGRKVAVFGCGDQHSYGDYFVDAMEELYSAFSAAGADMVGLTSTEGYEHSESKAEIAPGQFCGLALDQDNQDDLTEERINKWTAQVLKEMGVAAAAPATAA